MGIRHMISINFNGNCREAMDFYASVLNAKTGGIKTFGETPPDPSFPYPESYRDKVAISDITIGDTFIHVGDVLPSEKFIAGGNITMQLFIEGVDETKRIFDGLSEGGEVTMELIKTFYCTLCGSVTDKYGLNWHLMAV